MKSQRLYICFLNARLFPIGGTAIRTLNFARAIKNHVRGVKVITWQPIDAEGYRATGKASSIVREGISIDTMPLAHEFLRKHMRFLYILTLIVEYSNFVRRSVQEKKVVDLVHCANETIWVGVLLKRIIRKPIIADIHGTRAGLYQLFLKSALRIADKLGAIDGYLVPTEELRNSLVSSGLPIKKFKVIANAVNLHERRTEKSRATIRAELGLDEETIVAVFHGMLTEHYNIDALNKLSRISKIARKRLARKIKFVIIGPYEKVPIRDDSFIYTGYVENLHEYLKAADLAVIPIFENSLGIRSRLLDYFIASLPVLTTPAGVTGMRFAQGSSAVIVRNNVEELAQSVIELANSPGKLKEAALQSKGLAKWFSPRKIAEELLSFYLQTTKQQNRQNH